jgi:hypothetical protein
VLLQTGVTCRSIQPFGPTCTPAVLLQAGDSCRRPVLTFTTRLCHLLTAAPRGCDTQSVHTHTPPGRSTPSNFCRCLRTYASCRISYKRGENANRRRERKNVQSFAGVYAPTPVRHSLQGGKTEESKRLRSSSLAAAYGHSSHILPWIRHTTFGRPHGWYT